jgi:hypothetical protein
MPVVRMRRVADMLSDGEGELQPPQAIVALLAAQAAPDQAGDAVDIGPSWASALHFHPFRVEDGLGSAEEGERLVRLRVFEIPGMKACVVKQVGHFLALALLYA